ncbi:hypothetical protein JZ751_027191 [Albula glossodonta]|uniref:threonine--tRNA ligase n=1 Tax=Albula glossodonta TaxID=121402 RepID=A0A8T2NKA3_9TELE|nr:hypothetical protein JZ751_027191 [Albula glossodonta]
MAECMAARLSAQEEQIDLLSQEVSRLRDGLCGNPGALSALASTPELESLRSENEKLRYRILHLRRALQAELDLEVQGRQNAKTCPEKEKAKENVKNSHGHSQLNPWPSYIAERLHLYDQLKKESDALLAERAAKSHPISVELPNGTVAEAKAWMTTPYQLACNISQGLADNAVIARVSGELWDLDRPLEKDCSLEVLRAHILGEAMERFYGGCLCYVQQVQVSDFERESHYAHYHGLQNSSTYWEGRSDMETLQRVYGISFPDSKMLKEWERFQEEARNRDHRKIGKEEYSRRGFQEVASPNIYNSKLWETSGHWQHYSENILMFSHRPRSWRELPLRLADFGVLHRNELSGTLTGLTRVRRFQQDDAHIFCAMDQIESEMKGCLDFLRCVYAVFGFSFQLHLSTRPEKFLGDVAIWDQAEKQLENSLNEFGEPWKLNPGDGAFYGPKIDIKIKDAIGRYHQCATIQLDFQLPIRFNLTFVGKDGDDKARPVIIHRAILGSVERMIAILTENYAGKWPLWLSPRQVMLVPFVEAGFMADADLDSSCLLNKKIRNAQLAQYNFILVVGEKEKQTSSVNVRTRDNKVHGELSVSEVLARLTLLRQSRCRSAEEEF